MQTLERLFTQWSDAIWGPPMIILLLGTHLFLTFRLRFIQRYIGKAIKMSFSREREGEAPASHEPPVHRFRAPGEYPGLSV